MSTPTANRTPHGSRTGRANQRKRTRQAILRAATQLLDDGRTPTVADAADAAEVSRATAYRYFPSQEELLAECTLAQQMVPPEELFARPDAPNGAEDRVVYAHDFIFGYIGEREALFRHFLRRQLLLGLEEHRDTTTFRPGFRIGLLEAALAPVADELGRERLERLVHALSILIGTESLIVVKDVLELDDHTARADIGWACRQLVRAALADAATARPRPSARTRTSRAHRS